MRFDDRVTTLLAWEPRSPADRERLWRNLLDVLSQSAAEKGLLDDAMAGLERLGSGLPPEMRHGATEAVAARLPPVFRAKLADVPAPIPPSAPSPTSEIADLLARIDAFQVRRATDDVPSENGFAFRIDRTGRLHDAVGGMLLASCAEPILAVDGRAAGAWRAGVAFADARLAIGEGARAGEWRISAEPDGDCYRGTARRPRADETASALPDAPAPELSRVGAAIDRVRDPLAAITLAADPRALPRGWVRDAAAEVATRSAALIEALDALEIAVAADGDGGLDAAALLVRIDAALQPLAEAGGFRISFRLARGLPPVAADPQSVERMVARLIAALAALARRGERIVARLGRDRRDGGMLALSVTRPSRLLGRDRDALMGPASPAGPADAPELGLGFALRLVERLASEAGGRLTIHDDRVVLTLPLQARPRGAQARLP